MATTTAFIYRQGKQASRYEPISGYATIDSGETTTLPIPCHGRGLVRLGFPSNFDGATVTFLVQAFPPADPSAPTLAPPFRTLVDQDGTTVTYTITDNTMVTVPELAGCWAFEIVSASSESPAAVIDVQMTGEPAPFGSGGGGGDSTPSANNPNIATFVKPDVTVAGSSGAWTTANSPITIATVTGQIRVRAWGIVTTALNSTAGTGTLALGVSGTTNLFAGSSTVNGATTMLLNSVWGSLSGTGPASPQTQSGQWVVMNSGAIILTVGTNNMTAGGMTINFEWYPAVAGSGATLAAATP